MVVTVLNEYLEVSSLHLFHKYNYILLNILSFKWRDVLMEFDKCIISLYVHIKMS